jgi:hypothetical protein
MVLWHKCKQCISYIDISFFSQVDVTVSLDNIMMNDKTEDDSDSEFDFDLPTPASNLSTVKPVQQESTVKPVQTGPQVNQGQSEM